MIAKSSYFFRKKTPNREEKRGFGAPPQEQGFGDGLGTFPEWPTVLNNYFPEWPTVLNYVPECATLARPKPRAFVYVLLYDATCFCLCFFLSGYFQNSLSY